MGLQFKYYLVRLANHSGGFHIPFSYYRKGCGFSFVDS